MTTLQSTSPPQLEATALAASTLLLASTALSPKHVWALGFFWVIELAACMPDEYSQDEYIQEPRKKCKIGYAYHYRFKQCLRKKYRGNWRLEQIKHAYNPKTSRTKKPRLGEVPISHDDSYSPSGSQLLGYGDNLGQTPEPVYK